MDYNLETLGDDGFQKLCQALLTSIHPNVVCVPVDQPDGGRDAFILNGPSNRREPSIRAFIGFQVKYSRDPSSATEREAVIGLIRTEKNKVENLKARGLSSYYFL